MVEGIRWQIGQRFQRNANNSMPQLDLFTLERITTSCFQSLGRVDRLTQEEIQRFIWPWFVGSAYDQDGQPLPDMGVVNSWAAAVASIRAVVFTALSLANARSRL